MNCLTPKLIFNPEMEVNIYGQNDADLGGGSGHSGLEFGLRLRYEVRREIAPFGLLGCARDFNFFKSH